MATEIERKYLVLADRIPWPDQGERIVQGFLPTIGRCIVRVRVSGGKAWLTLKGPKQGISRSEFEYAIPLADAEAILSELCVVPMIEKTRYRIRHQRHEYEIDVFHGANKGLVVAEVELNSETEQLELPGWIAAEVTGDPNYYNVNLIKRPFRDW